MASNIPIETSSLVPKEPTRNLPFQMCQSPLVTPTSPLQSSLSVHERDLHQQESQEPSRNSGCMPLSDKDCNKQSGPVAPRKCRKERTMYSKEQKCLLQEHFDQCKNPDRGQRMALALLIGVTEDKIQTWFKNRRAKECQKSSHLPGRIGSGPHYRPTSNSGGEVPDFTASSDSVCQRHVDVSSPSEFRPSRNSPHQEFNSSLIDQPLEEMCFSKSHIISEHQRQKCRELPREPGHLSSDRSGCSNVPCSPSSPASADSLCEIPSGLSLSPQLGPSSMTQNSESTFSVCQTPSILSPLPELSPLSNSLDQMAIFSNIDQACEIHQNNTRSEKHRREREKDTVKNVKHDQDSCDKTQSDKDTVSLPSSACEDTLGERQSGFSSPPCSPLSTSPDSDSIYFPWEWTSHVSFPPPFSPSMFSEPESTLSIIQINENFISDAMMSV